MQSRHKGWSHSDTDSVSVTQRKVGKVLQVHRPLAPWCTGAGVLICRFIYVATDPLHSNQFVTKTSSRTSNTLHHA